jgi:hypothetical protein
MARKKQCPFHKKLDCDDCRLQRTGVRWVGIDRRKEDYSECVFTCICDNLEGEGIAMRQMQAEMGETKQAAIFQALAVLADSAQAKDELKRIIVNNFEGLQSLLGVASRKTTALDDLFAMVENEVGDDKDATRKITD